MHHQLLLTLIIALNFVPTFQTVTCYEHRNVYDETTEKKDCDYCVWKFTGDLRDDKPFVEQYCGKGNLVNDMNVCDARIVKDLSTEITKWMMTLNCDTDKCNADVCDPNAPKKKKEEEDSEADSAAVANGIGILMMVGALVI